MLNPQTAAPEEHSEPQETAAAEEAPFWRRALKCESETSWFILVNMLDYFMTYVLITWGDVDGKNLRFTESNPVALYFIYHWGILKGMLGFKLALVTFICVITQIIAIKREDLARKVLLFGTFMVACIVVYSGVLFVRTVFY